jgi:putative phosphoesterase
MRIAAIYDIHGNSPALEAVLGEIAAEQPDLILVGGDVALGPFPRATLDRLIGLGEWARFIRGNADRELVACYDGLPRDPALPAEVWEATTWVAGQLDRAHRDFLADLPEQVILPVDGMGEVLFCHASPRNDVEIITSASTEERVRHILTNVTQPVVVCGHTHIQFDRRVGPIRLVNAGSVGMPYGEPGAYWALLGPEVRLRRTPYDLERAAAAIRVSGYPQAQDFADSNVLQPPSAAEAVVIFEQMVARQAGP